MRGAKKPYYKISFEILSEYSNSEDLKRIIRERYNSRYESYRRNRGALPCCVFDGKEFNFSLDKGVKDKLSNKQRFKFTLNVNVKSLRNILPVLRVLGLLETDIATGSDLFSLILDFYKHPYKINLQEALKGNLVNYVSYVGGIPVSNVSPSTVQYLQWVSRNFEECNFNIKTIR